MMETFKSRSIVALCLAAIVAAGCTYPNRTEKLTMPVASPPAVECAETGDPGCETLVVVTASGGGTRAAAFTLGTFKLLQSLCLRGDPGRCEHTALDYVDLISSVSGSSVSAAHFARFGDEGFADLENHLKGSGFWDILLRFVEPGSLFGGWFPYRSQIDVLVKRLESDDQFRAHAFADHTFADLRPRPRLILNATDMGEGAPFALTPENFRLLCSDWAKFPLAEAVAASAAFPFAFGPLVVRNHSYDADVETAPGHANICPAHRGPTAGGTSVAGPDWVRSTLETGMEGLMSDRTEFRRAERARSYYTSDCNMSEPEDGSAEEKTPRCKEWIHLLDGGVADNLGISEPLWLLTNVHAEPRPEDSYAARILRRKIKRVVFIVINVRGDPPSEVELSGSPQGVFGQALAVTGGPIDATSDLLLEKLEDQLRQGLIQEICEFLRDVKGSAEPCDPNKSDHKELSKVVTEELETYVIPLDFDMIGRNKPGEKENPKLVEVRRYFQAIPTTWWLEKQEIEDLKSLPGCLMWESNELDALIASLGNTINPPEALKEKMRQTCPGYEIFHGHKASTAFPFD